jgi:hypothetical protein
MKIKRIVDNFFVQLYCICKSRNSSVGISTDYWLGGQVSNPGRGKIFLFSTVSRPHLGTTQPHIQWVTWEKVAGDEADHSPPSSSGVKKDGAIPPLPLISPWHSCQLNTGTTLSFAKVRYVARFLQ